MAALSSLIEYLPNERPQGRKLSSDEKKDPMKNPALLW